MVKSKKPLSLKCFVKDVYTKCKDLNRDNVPNLDKDNMHYIVPLQKLESHISG